MTLSSYIPSIEDWFHSLHELDLSHIYLYWNLESIAHVSETEIDRKYRLCSIKLGKIKRGGNGSFKM
jgi:hypothetical protein